MSQATPTILPFRDKKPMLNPTSRIAPNAVLVGDITVGEEANIWWNVVMRGDDNFIRIGKRSNVQDGTVIHVTLDTNPTIIGDDVVIGHAVKLHGCTIGNGALVGIGSIVLDGAVMEPGSMLAAGGVLTPNKVIPTGELWGGNPARKLRDLRQSDIDFIDFDIRHYVKISKESLPLAPQG